MFHPIAARPIAAKLNNPEITSAETTLIKNGKGKEFVVSIQQKARSQLSQSWTPQKIIENNKRKWQGLYNIYQLCASETMANQVFSFLDRPNQATASNNPINWQTVLKPAELEPKLPSLWALIAVDRFNKANDGDGDGFYSACVVYNSGVKCTVQHPRKSIDHRCLYCGARGHSLIATTLTPDSTALTSEWSRRPLLWAVNETEEFHECLPWKTIRQDFLEFAGWFVDTSNLASVRKFEQIVFPHADLAVACEGGKWLVDKQKKARDAAKAKRKDALKLLIAKDEFEKKYLELLKNECAKCQAPQATNNNNSEQNNNNNNNNNYNEQNNNNSEQNNNNNSEQNNNDNSEQNNHNNNSEQNDDYEQNEYYYGEQNNGYYFDQNNGYYLDQNNGYYLDQNNSNNSYYGVYSYYNSYYGEQNSDNTLDDQLKSCDVGDRDAVLELLKRSEIIESFFDERQQEKNCKFDRTDPYHQDYSRLCWSAPQHGMPFTIWCGCSSCALSTANKTSIHNVYPAHFFSNLVLTNWKKHTSPVRAVVKLFANSDNKKLHDTSATNNDNSSPRSQDDESTVNNASRTTPEDMFYQYRNMKSYSSERLTSFDFRLENCAVMVLVTRRHDNDLVPVLQKIYETTDSITAWKSRLALTRKFLLACLEIHGSDKPVIVHGDIKPKNIVVDDDYLKSASPVLFIDFEFSGNVVEKQGMTSGRTSTVFKTDFWCSILKQQYPQFRNTPRDDCYSIALVLYEIAHATGDPARVDSETKLALPQFMFDTVLWTQQRRESASKMTPLQRKEKVVIAYAETIKNLVTFSGDLFDDEQGEVYTLKSPPIPPSTNQLYAVTMQSLFEYYCKPRSFTRDLPYPYRRLLLLLQPSEFCSAINRLAFQLQAYKHDNEKKKEHCFWIPPLFDLLYKGTQEQFFLNLDQKMIEACDEYADINELPRVDFTQPMRVLEALRHLRNIVAHPVMSTDHIVASIVSNCSGIVAVLQKALFDVEEQSDENDKWWLNISNGEITYTTT